MSAARFGSGSSTDLDAARATAEASRDATSGFDGDHPDLVFAFFSNDHRDSADEIATALAERFPLATVIGCGADGIVAGPHELEAGPAVSVWAAVLPETSVVPFALDFVETGDGLAEYDGWPSNLPPDATVVIVCDPFSFPAGHLLQKMNEEAPGMLVIGGVASGVHAEGEARLLLGGEVRTSGAVCVGISGRIRVRPLVSQGCRPIGAPATITRADRNMIFELAGGRPVERINEIWTNATPRERALMQNGLFLGRVVDEYKSDDFASGDFVIRNVVGADAETGVVAVGDVVTVGETVQFHVRDPEAADEGLHEILARLDVKPSGALLFTCNGRGSNMFSEPDHDAAMVTKMLGTPLAGFFANGELGPIGSRNFWHSFTASIALFFDSAAR
ncbi:MAG: FIST signal transduction protein [Actinomycetota bacterium]